MKKKLWILFVVLIWLFCWMLILNIWDVIKLDEGITLKVFSTIWLCWFFTLVIAAILEKVNDNNINEK